MAAQQEHRSGSDDPSTQTAADSVERQLWSLSKALAGEADRLGRERKVGPAPNHLLMEHAAWSIVRASAEHLIDTSFDLAQRVPEARELVDEYASRIQARPAAGDGASDAGEGVGDTQPVRPEDPDDLAWRHAVAKVKIEQVLQRVAREGDPAAEALDRQRGLLLRVVKRAWEDMSERFPAALSKEAARIKHELLPGVDPWLGGPRDFVRASWVCAFLAERIGQRCDLRLSDAAKEYGVPVPELTRACNERVIVTNGKSRKNRRMNRASCVAWVKEYKAGLAKRKAKAKTRVPDTWWECLRCEKQYRIRTANKKCECGKLLIERGRSLR